MEGRLDERERPFKKLQFICFILRIDDYVMANHLLCKHQTKNEKIMKQIAKRDLTDKCYLQTTSDMQTSGKPTQNGAK